MVEGCMSIILVFDVSCLMCVIDVKFNCLIVV